MPVVPDFGREDLPQAMTTGPQADAAAAGVVGAAVSRLGDAAIGVATQIQHAANYDWLQNNLADYATSSQQGLVAARQKAAQTGDYKGVAQDFNAGLQQDQAQRIAGAPTPKVADAFKRHSTAYLLENQRQMNDYAVTGEYSTWNSNTQGSLDKLSTLTYQNPLTADTNYGVGLGIIKGAQAAGIGGDKVDWQQKIDAWGKQNYGGEVQKQIDTDPQGALTSLRGGKFDFILQPAEVENFARSAQVQIDRAAQKQQMIENHQIAMETRAEIQAERQQRQTQAANEADMMSSAIKGQPVDPGHVADMLHAQQISPAGADAILRANEAKDDPTATMHLYQQLGSRQLQPDDIMAAVSGRQIKASTGVELQRAWNEQQKAGDNQTERSAFNTLKTGLDGQAIEQGVDIFGANRAQSAALWTQAQGEWTQRVTIGHQDPMATLSDMMPRYSPKANLPTWLPAPQAGAITSPDDVQKIYAQTKAQFAAGQITPAQYQAQGGLLAQYQTFFDAKAKRDAAIQSVKPGKPQQGQAPALTPSGVE